MFLRKVVISGFKSFANKTTLEFLPACAIAPEDKLECDFGNGSKKSSSRCGITAIVGPNGSGKSNVADAIRWSMGEQSMKNLRGKKSEDIIFAGSGKKARLGSASVSLHFDNSDKTIPLEFSEVIITRKLYRSGESEYLINGSKVRLIDIVDLLAKVGVGKESYCVINQGMSDAVLNASPIERRVIIEDAAGVKQYQIKKERAIRKLESTKNNLERVSDLIKEIEPHLRMLKRQAEKAQKGKEVARLLKEKQIALYSFLWHVFQEEKENSSREKNNLGIKMMNVQREVDKINDEINKESKLVQNFVKQEELEREREQLIRRSNEWEKELVIAEGRIEIEKERQVQNKVIESIPVDLGYVQEKIKEIRENQEKLIGRIEKTETLEELQEIKEFARAIQQNLFNLLQEIGEGEIEIKQEIGNNANKESDEKIRSLLVRKEEIKKEIVSVKENIAKISERIAEGIEKDKESRQKFFSLEHDLRVKHDELNNLKDQFNEAKIKLARVEVREEDLIGDTKNELKMDVSELKYDGQPCDQEELEREINKMKVQMEQIGGIDPLVVEEYEETKKRFEFLYQESGDLENAAKTLREVAKEMEKRIGEEFAKAFERTNKEFTKYFRIIFGGGNAHLIKSKVKIQRLKAKDLFEENKQTGQDGENELEEEIKEEKEEIGVDIFACPPGKKISSLSMLSGGERSLTSIALLFAIISYNPPPFSILDEVEAALDEANSRRFGRILQELSSDTQFIVITHNRETMRQAMLLYGVTMGEDGISKLLSVRLDQVQQGGAIKK